MKELKYNFAEGPDHYKAMEIWKVIKSLCLPNGSCRMDKILFCYRRGIITEAEKNLVTAWICVFQIEEFAQ